MYCYILETLAAMATNTPCFLTMFTVPHNTYTHTMFSFHSPYNQLLHRVGIPELRVNVNFKTSGKKKIGINTNKHQSKKSQLASFPDFPYL